jgi:aminoglycoside phosphotransferase family enzyme/predicted kinase
MIQMTEEDRERESGRELAGEQRRIDTIARALSKSVAWPASSIDVDWIQTHISHVFLVGDRVFKMRKAVRLPFLDFATCADRNADCLREIHLNRRLAPGVYLGVASVIEEGEGVFIGSIQESIEDAAAEHVVVMRRLPSGHDALSMLEKGRLTLEHLITVGNLLGRFHAEQDLGSPAPWSADAWQARIEEPVMACFDALVHSDPNLEERVETLRTRASESMHTLRPKFEARRVAGNAVDGHGDLHLDHIWFEDEGEDKGETPLVIDCIEFNEDLRRIDRASEVAFLAMDLRYRGRSDLAEGFLNNYASVADDYGLFGVVDFFAAYRALVRAKVAALAARQSGIDSTQRQAARSSVERHLELAERLLQPLKDPGLILMCGTVGCGKSSVARELARNGRGVPIVSDRVRKVLAGLPAIGRSEISAKSETFTLDVDQGIYEHDQTERVYRALLERAAPVLDGGRTAILDASFSRRVHREAARNWAMDRGVPIRLIEVCCDPQIAAKRLAVREREGADPSDAGPEFLPISRSRFESPDEWPESDRERIWTS